MSRTVRFRVLDGIALVTIDAPPVNALSGPVRAGLWEVMGRVQADEDIQGVVILAAGPMFSAGADMRDFDGPAQQPTLPQLCIRIEDCTKPVVVALQGHALGGGAEMILAAHYRLVVADARIGLPEVALGLMPGAGGTQRLTRLIGAQRAVQMIVSTNAIDMASAHRAGLVDGIVEGDLTSGAVEFTRDLVARDAGPRRSRDLRDHLMDGRAHQAAVAKARISFAKTPLHAPLRVLECIEAATVMPFEAALMLEADAFERCKKHPQSVALRHVFAAERKTEASLLERVDAEFHVVAPAGKAVAQRLRKAMRAGAEYLLSQGHNVDDIDGAMVAYGFRKGPFGGREAGQTNDDITQALIAALVIEGAACVGENVVKRPSDIDALAVHGIGFPRRMGGPMRAAQSFGLIAVRKVVRHHSENSKFWQVPELLDRAIKDARGFDALA